MSLPVSPLFVTHSPDVVAPGAPCESDSDAVSGKALPPTEPIEPSAASEEALSGSSSSGESTTVQTFRARPRPPLPFCVTNGDPSRMSRAVAEVYGRLEGNLEHG